MHAFVAGELEHVGQRLEPNERIDVEVLPLGRSIEMIRSGEIHDAKTIATLLFYWTTPGNMPGNTPGTTPEPTPSTPHTTNPTRKQA